jgi:2,4-diacetamido-2,4,6-trideoxy-beta-L-gulose transferase
LEDDVGHVFIIAEAGVNHNGSVDKALALVAAAARAGADAVKFQTFKAEAVAAASAAKAAYQARETGTDESQLAMLRQLELTDREFERVAAECANLGIEFMSTAFDADSLDLLVNGLKIRRIKCPSGEVTNGPFLLSMARARLPLILSTGMACMDEIADALAVAAFGFTRDDEPKDRDDLFANAGSEASRAALAERVTVLHCTSAYPAPAEALNLNAMHSIRDRFGLPVGYSDHSLGSHICMAATAMGAVMLEKHFTLDRSLPGPDHKASLEPDELIALVQQVREVSQALGSSEKRPSDAELDTLSVARRSLMTRRAIGRGTPFSEADLVALRPAGGVSPMRLWELKQRTAGRDYAAGESIDPTEIAPVRRGLG